VLSASGTTVTVRFETASACGACAAKTNCTFVDNAGREIEAPCKAGQFQAGQPVNIIISESQGYTAILLGYVLPFVWLVATLAAVYALTGSETVGGIAALASLAPYYTLVWLLRRRLTKRFEFRIKEVAAE
jgi:sigma-E factor negative regulatory protein RseC